MSIGLPKGMKREEAYIQGLYDGAQEERARLWTGADLQFHFAMDHEGGFDECERAYCKGLVWLLADPASPVTS